MRVDCALLCDAVTVREGLLHILGGGVTRLNREEYPGPMGVALALRIILHPTEIDRPHQTTVIVQSSDGVRLMEAHAGFTIAPSSELAPGEEYSVPLQLPLHGVAIPVVGGYSVEVLVDGTHQASVPFQAVLVKDHGGM